MENLNDLIEIIQKTCVKTKDFKLDANPQQIANAYFEQQGVQNVLKILEAIRDRTIDIRELMRKE
jgi:hypothetical protein